MSAPPPVPGGDPPAPEPAAATSARFYHFTARRNTAGCNIPEAPPAAPISAFICFQEIHLP
ncbi:MAG: hypothetical protein KME26_31230 [Oscillatoria princeps RMCB-10]|nr:hypothetical protein [Oscillatoria princeps RMCB-10]